MAEFGARISNVRMKDAAPLAARSNVVSFFRDGLTNAMTGAGTTTDPRTFNFYTHRRMSYQQIESAYRGGWVMRRIIDKPAREMVREWRTWQADPKSVEALEKAERKLGVRQKIEKALQLAGLGGAGMVLRVGTDDPKTPINPAAIKTGGLKSIHVWHRSRFSIGPMITDPDNDWYGHPSYFQLNVRSANGISPQIHPSRVIAFKGQPVPDIVTATWEEAFWGESTVEVVLDAVTNCDTAQNGFASLIKDARNRRIYVPKLLEKTSTGPGEMQLAKRMAAFATGESMFGVTWLDAGSGTDTNDGERIEDRQMVWAGIPQIADMYMTAASGAADMPATVLWGKSPDGMNATGESDKDLWEQTIKGKQDLDAGPCMDQLDVALIPHATGKQADSSDIGWEWRPLSVMTEAEEALAFWNFMQGFQILVNSGTLPEIAVEKLIQNKMIESRWFPGTDTTLNEIPEGERFPSLSAPDEPPLDANGQPIDPNALQAPGAVPPSGNPAKGGDPNLAPGGKPLAAARRRAAANDAKPRPLYVQRKLVNAADLVSWAKAQGFTSTLPADEMHVTVCYSRQPVDWMKMGGDDWGADPKGNMTVNPGGARIVEPLGDKGAVVLLFASSSISYRHESMVRSGASHDFAEYQPHVTISYAAGDLDLSKVEPYRGKLVFGPEIFEDIDTDFTPGAEK